MRPTNLLYIFSDQHNRDVLGCYGHPIVQTPHLDRLAERGTRFTNAYTNCPICVPARASLATGKYVHQIGYWDNSFPYEGNIPSWHHVLRDQGYHVDSIGKLHFRSTDDDLGFTHTIEPLNVVEGVGDLLSAVRDNPPRRNVRPGIHAAGPGDSTYLQYDKRNSDNTCAWLRQHADDDRPWVLFASFVCPHPPYIAPPDLFDLYPLDDIPMPPQWREEDWPQHPVMQRYRHFFSADEPFEEEVIRRMNAAYLGVCTYLDQQIGRVLETLAEVGLEENTRIIYTSDHGENRGARGLFGKFTMYEDASAVPFIMAGPDVPQGKTVSTPISLVDSYPTILESVGAEDTDADDTRPGENLWEIANQSDRDRKVFCEYHAVGARAATYLVRNARYKYIHNVGDPAQLFDLHADPAEINDLAAADTTDPAHPSVMEELRAELYAICDPEATDAQAKADQRARVEAAGGREAVIARGSFTNSPVPGEEPAFNKFK